MKSPKKIKNGLEYLGMTLVADKERYIRKHGIAYAYAEDLAKDALEYIQQLEAKQPRWISVKERLPEDGQKIIAAFHDGGGLIVDQARYANGEFDFASWVNVWGDNITHWMPMPPKPEEEENGAD